MATTPAPLQPVNPATNDRSPLLQLPPKLRNAIYRYVVVGTGQIEVGTDRSKEPPLLLACKRVRQEAMAMFYAENTFVAVVNDYDISNYTKWVAIVEAAAERGEIQSSVYKPGLIYRSLNPNWSNLAEWMKLVHKNAPFVCLSEPSRQDSRNLVDRVKTVMRQRTSMGDIIGTMFATANVMRKAGLKWSDVEAILPEYREMLKNGDERLG